MKQHPDKYKQAFQGVYDWIPENYPDLKIAGDVLQLTPPELMEKTRNVERAMHVLTDTCKCVGFTFPPHTAEDRKKALRTLLKTPTCKQKFGDIFEELSASVDANKKIVRKTGPVHKPRVIAAQLMRLKELPEAEMRAGLEELISELYRTGPRSRK